MDVASVAVSEEVGVMRRDDVDVNGRFLPGHPKGGGRRRGVPNRARRATIDRILELSDPIGTLARIANGQPFVLAPEPCKEPVAVYPTLADVMQAATVLARKIMPDLRSVTVASDGTLVEVHLNLAPTAIALVEAG